MTESEPTTPRNSAPKFIDLKVFAISVSIAFLISLALSWFFEVSYWVAVAIVTVAVLVNGVIIAFEKE